MQTQIKIKLQALAHFDQGLGLPQFQSAGAAGADVCACFSDRGQRIIGAWERLLIPTGLAMEIPRGYELQVRPRSGLSLKTTLMVANAPGTIDADYRGEVQIILANLGPESVTIHHGDRVAQLVVAVVPSAQFVWAASLEQTQRGTQGFGSTGLAQQNNEQGLK